MTKVIEIEITDCCDCMSHYHHGQSQQCMCSKKKLKTKAAGFPSWCPLPNKQEKGETKWIAQ